MGSPWAIHAAVSKTAPYHFQTSKTGFAWCTKVLSLNAAYMDAALSPSPATLRVKCHHIVLLNSPERPTQHFSPFADDWIGQALLTFQWQEHLQTNLGLPTHCHAQI
jgi:hypothetical protein